jgi:hypothetical protein
MLAKFLRPIVPLSLALAMIAGAATARDYVVVASSEPTVPKGLMVDGGARLAVLPGHSVTLMHASGDLLMLKGAAGGVVAPARKAAAADSARLDVLRAMVDTRAREVSEGPGQRRSRSVCPAADQLTTLDAIAEVGAAGCKDAAAAAFDAWLSAQPATGQ